MIKRSVLDVRTLAGIDHAACCNACHARVRFRCHEPLEDHIDAELRLQTLRRLFFQQLAAVLREFTAAEYIVIGAQLFVICFRIGVFQKALDIDAVCVELACRLAEQRCAILPDAVCECHAIALEIAVCAVQRIPAFLSGADQCLLSFQLAVRLENFIQRAFFLQLRDDLLCEFIFELVFFQPPELCFMEAVAEMRLPIFPCKVQRFRKFDAGIAVDAMYLPELLREVTLDQIGDDLGILAAAECDRGVVTCPAQCFCNHSTGNLLFIFERKLLQCDDLLVGEARPQGDAAGV